MAWHLFAFGLACCGSEAVQATVSPQQSQRTALYCHLGCWYTVTNTLRALTCVQALAQQYVKLVCNNYLLRSHDINLRLIYLIIVTNLSTRLL